MEEKSNTLLDRDDSVESSETDKENEKSNIEEKPNKSQTKHKDIADKEENITAESTEEEEEEEGKSRKI